MDDKKQELTTAQRELARRPNKRPCRCGVCLGRKDELLRLALAALRQATAPNVIPRPPGIIDQATHAALEEGLRVLDLAAQMGGRHEL